MNYLLDKLVLTWNRLVSNTKNILGINTKKKPVTKKKRNSNKKVK